jgi:hypothetical protein
MKPVNRKIWTLEENEIMKKDYPHMSSSKVAEKMARSVKSVYAQASLLGLKKTKEFMQSEESGVFIKGSIAGKEYRFKKGNIPVNKGQKMSAELYEKCAKTMFKKGHIPATMVHNYEPYIYERTRENGYVERTWKIQHENKRKSYLVHLCQINEIDLTGKIPRLKDGHDINICPTINDIVVVSLKEQYEIKHFQKFTSRGSKFNKS